MSFTLVLNSSNVVNRNTNSTYQYNFIGGNFIVDDDMEVMLSSAQIPYSIFNTATAYNNNKLIFGFPTGSATNSYTTFNITFPDGFYAVSDIRYYVQQFCITNGLYLIDASGNNVYYVEFQSNPTYYTNQFYYILFLVVFRLVIQPPQIGLDIQPSQVIELLISNLLLLIYSMYI